MKPIIIADHRIPDSARESLLMHGELISMKSSGIVYQAISGHPDVFICKTNRGLIVAANTPDELIELLKNRNVRMVKGEKILGISYPETAFYNAVVTPNFIIHNSKYTDPVLHKACSNLEFIHVNQAYCRCTTLALIDDRFITSDKGIEKALDQKGLEVLYINPEGIVLPGFKHGFFGGTCSIYKKKVYFIGNLDHFLEGNKIRTFLSSYEIIELYDGPLFDGGGLIFPDG
jgi:hypothetical protein